VSTRDKASVRRLVLLITSFVEEVINQGQLERLEHLVGVDFVELDPLPASSRGVKVLSK
jgi:hypothetical protein